MKHYKLLRDVARKHSSVLFPGMSVSTLLAAFEIQKALPVYTYDRNYQFDNIWTENVLPLAKAEAKRLGKECMCDCPLVVEMARRIYRYRSREWTDLGFVIINNIRYWEIFKDIEDLSEKDDYYAWDYALEFARKNLDLFQGIAVSGGQIASARESLLETLFNHMEEERSDLPAYRLNAIKEAVRAVLERALQFIIHSRDGFMFGDFTAHDYVTACLDAICLGPQHHEAARQVILGYSEQLDWMKIVDSMYEPKPGTNMYVDEEEPVSTTGV